MNRFEWNLREMLIMRQETHDFWWFDERLDSGGTLILPEIKAHIFKEFLWLLVEVCASLAFRTSTLLTNVLLAPVAVWRCCGSAFQSCPLPKGELQKQTRSDRSCRILCSPASLFQASQLIVNYDEHEVNNTFKFGVIYQRFGQVRASLEKIACFSKHIWLKPS